MGEWSIEKPSSHPLASIDQSGKVTFADHDVTTAYTIKFIGTTAETKCEQTEIRGDIVVYPCSPLVPCECRTAGATIGSGTTSSKIVVGTHSSSNCSGGWSVSLKSGVNILSDIEFRSDGKIYANVISANTSTSARITQYNASIGSCSDYFTVTQLGNNPTPPTTYSYTLHTNHSSETVVFTDSSGNEYEYTTDSNGDAVHTATTNGQMTVRIVSEGEEVIDYGDGITYHVLPIYQYDGRTAINANTTVNMFAIVVRYTTNTMINNAAVVFNNNGKVWDYTNLVYDEKYDGLTLQGGNLPSWVNRLTFTNGTYDMNDSSADSNPGDARDGTFVIYINGISTYKSFKVFQT